MSIRLQVHVSTNCAVRAIVLNKPYPFHTETPINLNFKSYLFVENGKIQLMPKIMNHLFTYCLNCVGKSTNSTIAPRYFVGLLCAMTLLSDLTWEN